MTTRREGALIALVGILFLLTVMASCALARSEPGVIWWTHVAPG